MQPINALYLRLRGIFNISALYIAMVCVSRLTAFPFFTPMN